MHLFYFILDACLGCHKSKSVHFSIFHSNTLFGELEIYFRLFPESCLGISDMHNHEAGKLIQSRNLIPHIFEAFLLLHKKVIDWNSKPNSWNFKVNWKINFWRLNMIFRLWPTYVIAMNNLATVTDNESDIEVTQHCSTSKDFNLVNWQL